MATTTTVSERIYTLVTDEGWQEEGGARYEYVVNGGWPLLDGLQIAKAIHEDRRPGTEVVDWSVNQPAAATSPH